MEILKSFRKPLERMIAESVEIEKGSADVVMNSKGEWGGSRIPRITIEVGEKVLTEDFRGRKQGRRKANHQAGKERKMDKRKESACRLENKGTAASSVRGNHLTGRESGKNITPASHYSQPLGRTANPERTNKRQWSSQQGQHLQMSQLRKKQKPERVKDRTRHDSSSTGPSMNRRTTDDPFSAPPAHRQMTLQECLPSAYRLPP